MKKFFVIYRVPVETMKHWKETTSPEEMKAQGEKLGAAMMAWSAKHEKNLVDRGLPLGKNKRITAAGVEDVTNDLNYCCVVEAESHEAAVAIFKDNPHFDAPDAFIDVMEVPHMGL